MTPRQTAKYIKGIPGIENDTSWAVSLGQGKGLRLYKNKEGKIEIESQGGYTSKEVERMNKEFEK